MSRGTNGTLNSEANSAASAGVRLAPIPPMTIGGCGSLRGFEQRRRIDDGVVLAGEVERLPDGRVPESGQNA